MEPPTTPTNKRRKLSLLNTMRVRNGGGNTSFLTVANTPPSAREPDGSDTEDEEDEETAQYYLNKMSDDTDRGTETVFGKGVEVWKSMGGTVYADLTDSVKRKMREEELWNEEAMSKISNGLKRKIAADEEAQKKQKPSSSTSAPAGPPTNNAHDGQVTYPSLPKDITCPSLPFPSPTTPNLLPLPAAPSHLPTSPYPPRNPTSTQFHHSSAGIDPLGAYNRPLKPLPKRRVPTSATTTTAAAATTCTSPPFPDQSSLQTTAPQLPVTGPGARPLGPLGRGQIAAPAPPEGQVVRRIVSGSFGSFEGVVGRFDERAYRLGGGRGDKTEGGDEGGETRLDVFKGRPWLRR